MPREIFTIQHGGEEFDIEANSPEEALSFVTSQAKAPVAAWQPSEASAPAPEASMDGEGLSAEDAAKGAGAIGGVAGIAAPLTAAYLAGAPLAPVVGGIGAGLAIGKGVDVAGRHPFEGAPGGLFGLLEDKGQDLRKDLPEPQVGGDFGVPINFLANLGIEATHPKAIAANVLETVPMATTSAAAGYGAAKAVPAIRGLGELIKGTPKVPVGQEANALLTAIEKQQGPITPPVAGPADTGRAPIPKIETTGQLRDTMSTGREVLGAPVGAARSAAYDAIKLPKDFGQQINNAAMQGLVEGGNAAGMMGKFDPKFSKSPKASQDVISTIRSAVGQVDSLEKAQALQRQFAGKAATERQRLNAMSPGKATSPEADVYDSAARSIDKYIKSLIPAEQLATLESANKPFSAFSDIQNIVLKSNAGGKFSPQKFKAQWDSLKQAQRSKMDPTGEIEAMVKKGDPSILERFLDGILKATGTLAPGPTGRAARLIDRFAPNPVRFNAPPRPAAPTAPIATSAAGLEALLQQ